MTRLIEPEEIVAEGERLLGNTGLLRSWYDLTLAIRTAKSNRITTAAGVMEVGKTYNVTIKARPPYTAWRNPDKKYPETKTLRGWMLDGRTRWSDGYMAFHKPRPGAEYLGARREINPSEIVSFEVVE